jgi:protein-S-isoprenylcysteine O-methyltransferase Ste14
MFWRALFAFLALPGVVAFAVPLLLINPPGSALRFAVPGLLLLVPGLALLFWCVGEFYVAGRGTLAPWSPPRHLVTSGPYRYSRNPMYVAVLLVLFGWALGFRSLSHAAYAGCVALAVHLRVVLGEEPWLARTHGPLWVAYSDRVARWIGRSES